MISFSMICTIGSLLIVVELLKPVQKNFRVAFWLCSLVFGISAMTSLFRIIYIFLYLPGEALVPTPANQLFYFMLNVTQALLLFSFLLLISLKIAERLEMKVQAQRKFFSVIAHDLSGPVCTVSQMLELANNDDDLDEVRRKYIYKEVEKLSESTYHLLQNLLLWSRNQLEDLAPVIRKFDLNIVLLENIDFLRQMAVSKGITIQYEPTADLLCMADSRMIDTVVRNLVSNAIKYTNSGGKVTISCEKDGKFMLVKIADNGVGMNEVVQNNLFKFNDSVTKIGTGGERGTGLGLYLCKEFIEENNGSMVIQSQLNVGTEVVVSLPAE
jgi:signal transduction histidine kinase